MGFLMDSPKPGCYAMSGF